MMRGTRGLFRTLIIWIGRSMEYFMGFGADDQYLRAYVSKVLGGDGVWGGRLGRGYG